MLSEELSKEFMEHMIPFWCQKADPEYGGYYGQVGYDLQLDKKADKGCILNSRILWFFSNLYEMYGDKKYLDMAKIAYRFMLDFFFDKEYGGVYWSVTYDGKPKDTSKHSYNHAFAIYALSSYYIASGDEEALDKAYNLFDIIETRLRDKDGYLESFDRFFGISSNEKLSENGVEAARTMNTILHIMEAYTELYRADADERVKTKLREILMLFRNKIYNSEKKRLEVFFDADYNSLIDLHSYGHDIEAAWLIDRTVEVLGDKGTEYDLSDITSELTQKIYEVAYDGSSVPAECEEGKVLGLRIWWVECEAMVGFMNGYQKDKSKVEYREAVEQIWRFIKDNIVDRREGSEWYYEVDENNVPSDDQPVLAAWKCPYHNGRMFMEIVRREGDMQGV
ncbi:MAG: AGE family epimerase/isomerase [Eubacterium sp.]|nr:AGE family epimerase/isomerase [Eubacterium sp.]